MRYRKTGKIISRSNQLKKINKNNRSSKTLSSTPSLKGTAKIKDPSNSGVWYDPYLCALAKAAQKAKDGYTKFNDAMLEVQYNKLEAEQEIRDARQSSLNKFWNNLKQGAIDLNDDLNDTYMRKMEIEQEISEARKKSWYETNQNIYDWMKTDPGGVDSFSFNNLSESSSDVFGATYGLSTLEKSSKTVGHLFDKHILK